MRPILLKFSGIHSYIDEQVIDFTKLGNSHIFGIFGPTGSGKSTILDAITLSLYGQVERAPNKTQGILNHQTPHLTVSFTFELGSDNRYQVERRLSANKQNPASVRTTLARLSRITSDGATVIADKEGEVTRSIQEILGLNIDDFTRAVVLPQGKFAEFLTLTGRDRRDMLQRLFNLQAYGDELARKVKTRLDELNLELDRIEAEQRGLPDASLEAVALLTQEYEEAKLIEAQLSAKLTALERERESRAQIWQLQTELSRVNQEIKQLEAERERIDHLQTALSRAKEGEKFRYHLVQTRELSERIGLSRKTVNDLADQLTKLNITQQEAKKKLQQAKLDKDKQTPQLQQDKMNFLRGLELEEEITETTKRIAALTSLLTTEQHQADELSTQKQSLQDTINCAEQDQQRLEAQLKELNVSSAYRKFIEEAFYQAQVLVRAEEDKERAATEEKQTEQVFKQLTVRFEQVDDQYHSATHQLAVATEAVDTLEQNPPCSEEDLNKEQRFLDGLNTTLRELNFLCQRKQELNANIKRSEQTKEQATVSLADLQARQQNIEQAISQLTHELDDLHLRNLAGKLAAKLVVGSPCPVCGSMEHPQPTDSDGETTLLPLQDKQQKLQADLNKLQQDEANRKAEISVADKQITELSENLATVEQQVHQLCQTLPQAYKSLSLADLSETAKQLANELARKNHNLAQWKDQLRQAREEQRKRDMNYKECLAEYQSVSEEYNIAKARCEEAAKRSASYQCTAEKEAQEFTKLAKGKSIEQVRQDKERLSQADERREELEKQLSRLHTTISHNTKQLGKLQEELQELLGKIEQHQYRLGEEQDLKTKAEDKLQAMLNGVPSAQIGLDQVARKLTALEKNIEEYDRQLEQCQAEYLAVKEKHTQSVTKLEADEKSLTELSDELHHLLQESCFASLDQVAAALKPQQQQDQWETTINSFAKEYHALVKERADLEVKLDGREITEEEWLTFKQHFTEKQEQKNEAMRLTASRKHRLESAKGNHERWKVLEDKRVKYTKEQENTALLQSVLKGNAFVEFIAEQQLATVAYQASEWLRRLTRHRFALEVDSTGGFVMRDDHHGGVLRPVHTLSGGETFLASLALALSLSNQIQLKGSYPLEFFFLDEGFGSLDPELLDTVMTALETLEMGNMTIGLISHVPELKHRIQARIVVTPAQSGGQGSRVTTEIA